MKSFSVKPVSSLKGCLRPFGDKSIAHRAVILSSIAKGKTVIRNFPFNDDCLATVRAFRALGIKINQNKKNATVTVFGKGLAGLTKPRAPIFVNDSGTTLRLITGILAAQSFKVTLKAGKSLSRRPMSRVAVPLRLMGANIISRKLGDNKKHSEEYPPLVIKGGSLKAISYRLPVASAQVKSALLLAGLYASGETCVIEKFSTRDHTERMLKIFKAGIITKGKRILIRGNKELSSPRIIGIPGDISSASFFIVLAAISAHSRLVIEDVGLNPGRIGILRVLKRMGASIQIKKKRLEKSSGEPVGMLIIKTSSLKAVSVRKKEIPFLIDELPILMVAACFAHGKTTFEGAEELRVKETDRIRSMAENLRNMGASVKIVKNGTNEKIIIEGKGFLKGNRVKSYGDHRTAMSMIVAGLASQGVTYLDDISCINKSFPNFLSIVSRIAK